MALELEALERRGWESLSGTHGARFYDALMADDGLMVFPGAILDKTETIRAISAAAPWLTFELTGLQVIEAAPECGIVTYRASARRKGAPAYEAAMSTTYVRRDGRWRLVLHQQTPDIAAT